MKLSDAILLGATITEHQFAYDINSCALGMAANALGMPKQQGSISPNPGRLTRLGTTFPWLLELRGEGKAWGNWIANTFNDRVATEFPYPYIRCMLPNQRMTLEELVEEIRKAEPECGECNCFECRCDKNEKAEAPVELVAV
jgi:hypothetical protein